MIGAAGPVAHFGLRLPPGLTGNIQFHLGPVCLEAVATSDTHKHAMLMPLCCFPQKAVLRLPAADRRLVRSVPLAQVADLHHCFAAARLVMPPAPAPLNQEEQP